MGQPSTGRDEVTLKVTDMTDKVRKIMTYEDEDVMCLNRRNTMHVDYMHAKERVY